MNMYYSYNLGKSSFKILLQGVVNILKNHISVKKDIAICFSIYNEGIDLLFLLWWDHIWRIWIFFPHL